MDVSSRLFYIGFAILCFIIIGYIFVLVIIYYYRNPKDSISNVDQSTQYNLTELTIPNNIITIPSTMKNQIILPSTSTKHPVEGTLLLSTLLPKKLQSIVTHTYLGTRGDMGNQLFQLACIISAGKRSQAITILPTRISSLPISKLFNLKQFERKDIVPNATFYEYDNYENIMIPKDSRKYDVRGYRQSYHYFDDFSEDIRRIFTPKRKYLNSVRAIVPPVYIAVHIRKGDYIKFIHKIPLLREFRRCQLEYYKKGIQKLRETYSNCPLLVCTDSPEWVIPFLSELDPQAILAPIPENINPKFSDFCTLYLANGVVISNSSFSWWAAYLTHDKQVICPNPWWDPSGFIGTAFNLTTPYLEYPNWWILDADTGKIVREPCAIKDININYDNDGTLNIYKLIRATLL